MGCAARFFLVIMFWTSFAQAAPKADLWPYWDKHEESSAVRIDHSAWDRFLKTYVAAGDPSGINLVRYGAVAETDRKALDGYLSNLQKTVVTSLNRTEQKAFWINLYNALTVRVILTHYPIRSIRDIDISPGWFRNGPWDAKLARIEGHEITLNDIEHRILRPIWKDPRVHYAVNCASLGCPNLQPVAFIALNTEELLDKAARQYVNHPRGAHFEKGELVLSSIYDWFQGDFGKNEKEILNHLRRYAEPGLDMQLQNFDGSIRYEYDWRLNGFEP
ncbi:MAG: DUF547 domain-containing protein [Deltaproteobacteria bacterium]|nr:DUF547 domain-containing protein [Deltaproteobacteria bacterium]